MTYRQLTCAVVRIKSRAEHSAARLADRVRHFVSNAPSRAAHIRRVSRAYALSARSLGGHICPCIDQAVRRAFEPEMEVLRLHRPLAHPAVALRG